MTSEEDRNTCNAIYRGQYIGSNSKGSNSGKPPSPRFLRLIEQVQRGGQYRIGQLLRLVTNRACCRVVGKTATGWLRLEDATGQDRRYCVPPCAVVPMPWTSEPRFGVDIWQGQDLELPVAAEGGHA